MRTDGTPIGQRHDPIEQIRKNLVDRIAEIIDKHHATGVDLGSGVACSCGAQEFSKHPRHVADQIADQLGLKPEIDEVKKGVRYASAMFDWELTQMEGAQCGLSGGRGGNRQE
jgi:hypothetical protein